MTGANSFTRTAGACGLLASAVLLAGLISMFMTMNGTRGFERSDATAYFFAVLGLTAVHVAGMYVRHRHIPLTGWAARVLVLAPLLGLAFESWTVAGYCFGASFMLLVLVMFAADELPRAPIALVAMGLLPDEGFPVFMLVASVGWTWLAFAMWREPLASRPEVLAEAAA